jgi:hypothetical protein
VAKVRKVISLKDKGDFLMHGVVLQNRFFGPCRRDVSRETIFPSAADSTARCFT